MLEKKDYLRGGIAGLAPKGVTKTEDEDQKDAKYRRKKAKKAAKQKRNRHNRQKKRTLRKGEVLIIEKTICPARAQGDD